MLFIAHLAWRKRRNFWRASFDARIIPGPRNLNKERLFSSVQSLDQLGHQGDMRDDSAEILFQSFLQEVLVGSFGMGGDVHSLMFIQHFLCRPWCGPLYLTSAVGCGRQMSNMLSLSGHPIHLTG